MNTLKIPAFFDNKSFLSIPFNLGNAPTKITISTFLNATSGFVVAIISDFYF
jgi:hypothetical protein